MKLDKIIEIVRIKQEILTKIIFGIFYFSFSISTLKQ